MSQRKNYSRYFIILQEDEKGYGLASDKLPTGYAKLEVKNGKCKITFYVQNLKKEMKPYYLLLIFKKKDEKKIVKLGELNIDDAGKAEVSKDYDANNIAGTGIQIDKISGAAVVKFVETNITSVMNGFTSTEVLTDWKGYDLLETNENEEAKQMDRGVDFEKYESEIEKTKEEVKSIEVDRVKEVEVKVENEVITPSNRADDVEIEINKNEQVQAKQYATEEPNKEELKLEDSINSKDVRENEETDTINKNVSVNEKVNEELSEDKGIKKETNGEEELARKHSSEKKKSKSNEFFENITKKLEVWEDEFEEISRSKWYSIPIATIEDMYKATSHEEHSILYYPMINYFPYIIRHGHYMFGYKYDKNGKVKYLAYAIPGTKAHYDQPFGGKYGFVTWTQPKQYKGKYGNMGYWLMFYDFRKSVVVIPVNKTGGSTN